MTGGEDADDWKHQFYWSFHELNNGKVIVLNHTENLVNGKLIDNQFDCTYGSSELKNGEIIKYRFGNAKPDDVNAMSKEFFDYFDSNPPVKDLKSLEYPTKDEEKCVIEFYKKYIIDKKDEKTGTLEVMMAFIDFKEFKKHYRSFDSISTWTKEKYNQKDKLINFLNKHENLYYECSQAELMISTKMWTPEILEIPLNRRGHLKKYRGLKILMINISRPNQFKFEVGCYPLK